MASGLSLLGRGGIPNSGSGPADDALILIVNFMVPLPAGANAFQNHLTPGHIPFRAQPLHDTEPSLVLTVSHTSAYCSLGGRSRLIQGKCDSYRRRLRGSGLGIAVLPGGGIVLHAGAVLKRGIGRKSDTTHPRHGIFDGPGDRT
jgi:hypothetical protein